MLAQGEELRGTLEAHLGCKLPDQAVFIGNLGEDGEPVSVAAFANWYGHDAEIYMWSAGIMSRAFLKALGRYAFGDLGCRRITSRVAADNPWASVIVRLGFREEGRLRHGYDGDIDLIIFGVLKDEYRYGR